MTAKRSSLLAACAAMAVLAGCESATGTGAGAGARVSLSLSAGSSADASLSANRFGPSLSLVPVSDSAGHTIDIQSVQLVLKNVELKRDREDECHGTEASCEKFRAGPTLVNLPLSGGLVTPFTEAIAPGTYDELRLKIGAPEEERADSASFYASHPEWPRKASIRVKGTYDAGTGAQPFDVFLGVNAKVQQQLDSLLVVDSLTTPAAVNLTLEVDVNSWFRGRSGSLIDPRSITTSPALVALVENNVRRSFRALRDDNRDGDDDRGHGKGGGNSGKGKGNGGGDDDD